MTKYDDLSFCDKIFHFQNHFEDHIVRINDDYCVSIGSIRVIDGWYICSEFELIGFNFFSETSPSSFVVKVFAVPIENPSVLQKIGRLHYSRATNNELVMHFDMRFRTKLIVFRGHYRTMSVELFVDCFSMPANVVVQQQQQVTDKTVGCLCVVDYSNFCRHRIRPHSCILFLRRH